MLMWAAAVEHGPTGGVAAGGRRREPACPRNLSAGGPGGQRNRTRLSGAGPAETRRTGTLAHQIECGIEVGRLGGETEGSSAPLEAGAGQVQHALADFPAARETWDGGVEAARH